jgi:hypothetical protein
VTIKVESASAVEPAAAATPVVEVTENADVPAASLEAESSDESGKSKEEQETEGKEAAEDKEVEEKEGDEAEEKSAAKKPNKGVQKRFGELTKARSVAEQKAAEAEKERDYWRELATKAKKPELDSAETESTGSEGEPQEDDFESHAAYVKALAKHEAKAEFEALKKAEAEKAKEESVRSERSKQVESWNKQADTLREKHDDYDDLMAETPMPPPAIAAALYKSGPELAYALAKNREVLDRIYALDPIEAVYELGQFKASLQAPAKTEPKTITKAPAPINPIAGKGGGGTVRNIFTPDLSQAEYEALRAKSAK